MATISKPTTFSSGATIFASEHNNNFDTMYNDYNGNITNVNIATGAAIVASKLDMTASGPIGSTSPSTGAFTTLTASGATTLNGNTTIGNGADTLTINSSTGITYTPAATWTFTGNQTVSGTWADLGTVSAVSLSGVTNLGMTTVTDITDIVDEDDMTSDSAANLCTQQSIKAYADSVGNTFGAWGSATVGSSTQVSNDSFIVGWIQESGNEIVMTGKTDSAATPTTVRVDLDSGGTGAAQSGEKEAFMMPVKADDYYLLTQTNGTITAFIISLS